MDPTSAPEGQQPFPNYVTTFPSVNYQAAPETLENFPVWWWLLPGLSITSNFSGLGTLLSSRWQQWAANKDIPGRETQHPARHTTRSLFFPPTCSWNRMQNWKRDKPSWAGELGPIKYPPWWKLPKSNIFFPWRFPNTLVHHSSSLRRTRNWRPVKN